MVIVVLIAIFAPWLAPGDPFTSNMSQALQAPSSHHWFGTDKLGRDVLSRVIYGTQLSLFMGVSIVVIMVSIGTIIGAVAGYFGGKIETILMRLADIMLSFPGIVLAIAIAGILGGSIVNTIIALSVVGWAKYARLVLYDLESSWRRVCNSCRYDGGIYDDYLKTSHHSEYPSSCSYNWGT